MAGSGGLSKPVAHLQLTLRHMGSHAPMHMRVELSTIWKKERWLISGTKRAEPFEQPRVLDLEAVYHSN
jgi:hypothetical protein